MGDSEREMTRERERETSYLLVLAVYFSPLPPSTNFGVKMRRCSSESRGRKCHLIHQIYSVLTSNVAADHLCSPRHSREKVGAAELNCFVPPYPLLFVALQYNQCDDYFTISQADVLQPETIC